MCVKERECRVKKEVREGVRQRGIEGKSCNGGEGRGDSGMEGERKDWKERGKEGRCVYVCVGVCNECIRLFVSVRLCVVCVLCGCEKK